jgi:outer membrane receptor protein involved in Fe transport
MITSLNVESDLLKNRLTTLFTARNYFYQVGGKTVDLSTGESAVPVSADVSRDSWGYSFAGRYAFARSWLLKLALEHNYRLPRSEELLGDRVRFSPNTKLRPEQANNYNFGIMLDRYYNGFTRLQFEANAYATVVRDMMQTRSAYGYITYYNLGKALLTGGDAEVKWDINRDWFVMINGTYQQSIDKAEYLTGTTTPSVTYNKQIPHIPILFFNWSLDFRKDNFLGWHGQYARFYYEGGYTDKYYYGYNLTDVRNYIIPSSFLHTIGAEYSIHNRRILLSLECHNIFNARELTNLNYPLAGRTIQAKIRITTLKW